MRQTMRSGTLASTVRLSPVLLSVAVLSFGMLAGCGESATGGGGGVTTVGGDPNTTNGTPDPTTGQPGNGNPGTGTPGSGNPGTPNGPQPVANDAPDTQPPGSRLVELRVRGVNALWPVELSLRSVVARANGQKIPVTLATGHIRLDSVDHAWRVGTLELPEGVDAVRFEARFAANGALYEGQTSRPIDLSGAPMVFTSTADHLLWRHKVVIDLDVNRSLEEEELGATVLPHFNVRY